ncbi:MAG TPA: alpha/beta hydrolase [Bacteroidia bacterium]
MKCHILILFLLSALLNSCSSYKFANKHVSRKLEKSHLELHTAELEKYTVNYWDSGGEKPALIMLHGFGTATQFNWYKQVAALKNYRVILPNLLYFGGTVPKIPSHSVADQVKTIQALVKHLGVTHYYLCGISYGGLVAAELALAEPIKVKKLALFDAPVKYLKEEDLLPVYQQLRIKHSWDLLVPTDYKMLKNLMNIALKHPPMIPGILFKDVYNNLYVEHAENQRELLNTLESERPLYESREYNYKFPVLLLWGEEDRLIPKHVGIDLQKHIGKNARLKIIPNTAHMPNIEEPKKFNKILLEFLNET